MNLNIETEYKDILRDCFASDPNLLDTWHIRAGLGLEECVEKTHEDLKKASIQFFRVAHAGKTIGYFGREIFESENYLTGFFLKPSHRNPVQKSLFWELVIQKFDQKPFYCGLYKKNIPAIKFIESRGGKLIREISCSDGQASLFKVGA